MGTLRGESDSGMRLIPRSAFRSALALASLLLAGPVMADPPVEDSPVLIAQETDLDFWNTIKDSQKAEDYQAYLDKYPNGDFADLAKLRLKKYAPEPAPAPEPAAKTPTDQEVEIAFWNAIKDSQNAEDYQLYLTKYPKGFFVDLAKLRIEQLRAPAPAPEPDKAEPAPVEPAAVEPPAPQPAPEPQPAPTPAPAALAFVAKDTTLYAKGGGQVRAEPDAKSTLVVKLKTNAEVHATGLSSDGRWWRVEVPGGQSGYMHRSVVSTQRVTAAAPKTEQAAAPTGPDEEVCQPTSEAAPNDRVSACERLVKKAGSDDTAKLAALSDLAAALAQAHRYDTAIRKYEQAAALAPRDASIYYRIGLVRLDQLRFPEARSAFEKAAQLDSKNPDIVFERGISYIGLGDFEKARLEVKRALLTKDSAAYYEKLGEIEIARGDLDSAKVALERGAKADAGRRSLILAVVNYFAATPDQAVNQVSAVVDDPTAALWNAVFKKAKGDATGAAQALEAGRAAVGDAWPAPIFDALSGALSADKARAAARSKDANVQFQHLCALNFFLGEWAHLSGDNDAARAALKAATDTRAYYMLEYAAAKARLANMGG